MRKKTLTNEDNSLENPLIINSEINEAKVNLETKTLTLKNDEIYLKALKFKIENLKEVPKAQTLKVKSKEEKKNETKK